MPNKPVYILSVTLYDYIGSSYFECEDKESLFEKIQYLEDQYWDCYPNVSYHGNRAELHLSKTPWPKNEDGD